MICFPVQFGALHRRLDDLLRWMFEVIQQAYGLRPGAIAWPLVDQQADCHPS
ncbi:MAG: hypothetical protein P4L90_15760 [Rhodopila sp.]|nr:hypothetical protein [Rhodopila sp.]